MKMKLGDIADFINGGAWSDKEYVESGIPVVKVTNLKNETVELKDLNFIPESSLDKYQKNILRKGDLVIATVGSHPNLTASAAGRATIIPEKAEGFLLNQNALCIRTKSKNIDQGYLGCFGKSPEFQGYLRSIGRGAANQVRISIGLIKEFEYDFPPLPTQRRIASILSAYDDLIENNLKQIKLLEEKAFLGYKHIVKEEKLSEIKLKEVASVNKENIKTNSNLDKILYVDIAAVSTGSIDNKTEYELKDAPGRAKRIIKHQDIIWSCVRPNRKSYSFVWQPENNLIASTGFAVITAKEIPATFLYQLVTANEFVTYLENHAKGATYPAVTAADFEEATIRICSNEKMNEYHNEVNQLFELKYILQKQNTKLREARDILLPRLMSGEIEV